MGENVSAGSRPEFLARVQRFADEMLDNLIAVSRGEDVDEKEARVLRSVLLKLLSIWDKALLEGRHDPRLTQILRRIEKQASQVKDGEA